LQGMDHVLGGYCQARGLRYFRFMDDWLVLCKTRHQLRGVVALMNHALDEVFMTKHPFKTYIGRLGENGFDFLGCRLSRANFFSLAWFCQTKSHAQGLRDSATRYHL